MKRCPGCDRSYPDDKLSFCVSCGGVLVIATEDEKPAHDPLKTMVASSLPGAESWVTPATPVRPLPAEPSPLPVEPLSSEPPVNPSWAEIEAKIGGVGSDGEPSTGLAMGAMIGGLVTLFCGVLSFLGPVAAILGIVALSRHKADPGKYGGKNFAIVGIVTGILATLELLTLLVLLLVALLSSH